MEEYIHCKKFFYFDPSRHEKFSFTARDEPASSSSSSPEFHIDFRLSCKPLVFDFELCQDSRFLHPIRMLRLPSLKKFIRINFDQYSNRESACQIIGEEVKSWPLGDDGRRLLIDFVLEKAQDLVTSMASSHNAVYLDVEMIPVHIHVFDEREAIRSAMERSMGEQEDGMVPAAESVIKSLESMKITSSLDDSEACPVCLEEFSRDREAICMPCSHVFHGDCIKEWLRTSHYCPICRFEMPTN